MKAISGFLAAVPYIVIWIFACGSFIGETIKNSNERPTQAGQVTAEFTNSLGMKFVLIPAGTFLMGSPLSETGRDSDERRHKVTLTHPFYLQTTEVTQGQWQAVMGVNPSHFRGCGETCPVERVSWHDAQRFIVRLKT